MRTFPIVGIGSSAGGLEPLQKLFRGLPADLGLGYVVAAHLDPTHESYLSELLARCTGMPVAQIDSDITVEPNHVYVIAPDQEIGLENGVLKPVKPDLPRGQRRPIDRFFRSLGEDQGPCAIGIVLSGTGNNGSHGLRFIKAEGGIVIAQDPASAGFDGMPLSAIATGVIDLTLTPEDMPEALQRIATHRYIRQPEAVSAPGEDLDDQVGDLLMLVRQNTGKDFRPYRRSTLLRRIHRRMGLQQIDSLSGYLRQLAQDPGEVVALSRDLTINVTGFFRDEQAWHELDRQVVQPLVAERPADGVIRAWVPGCATGEEAYSLAMLISERAQEAGKLLDVRIFATDVADTVLPTARAGIYPASIAADVGPERLERFFEPGDEDTYAVRNAIREAVTFAPQNLLQDPPFSKLDLIACRNLLIYLEPEVQKRVLVLFHFALREDGHLFLGTSETTSSQPDLFEPLSKKWRVYRRLGSRRRDVADFPLIRPEPPRGPAADDRVAPPLEVIRPRIGDAFQRALLERHAPASVLIDRHCNVQVFHGPTGDYLQQPGGEGTSSFLALVREGLLVPLRMAVQRAFEDQREVVVQARVKRRGTFHPVRLTVAPLRSGRGDQFLLVSFAEAPPPALEQPAEVAEVAPESGFEAELRAAREDLRLTVEQMDTAQEELRASYEEIRSMNEELQASNEELETSKEELQSLNEELKTVNSQLQAKVEELESHTDDLNNLLNSTDVATLFLDRHLRVRWFTPAMKTLLDLLPGDVGRPIYHLAQKFTGADLVDRCQEVMRTLVPEECETAAKDDHCYIRRIIPYRTEDDRIDGVVVTYADVTRLKQSERAVRSTEEMLRLSHEVSRIASFEVSFNDTRDTRVSPEWQVVYGLPQEQVGAGYAAWLNVVHEADRDRVDREIQDGLARRAERFVTECRIVRQDGESRSVEIRAALECDDHGQPSRLIGVVIDLTERARSVEFLERRNLRHQILADAAARSISGDDAEVTLTQLFQAVHERLGIEICFNYVLDEFGRTLRLDTHVGLSAEDADRLSRLPLGQAICGMVAETGRSAYVPDVQSSDDPRAGLIRSMGVHVYASYPLAAGGRVLGTLSFGSTSRDRFDQEELAFFQTVSHQIAAVKQRQATERERELLTRELSHRVRNVFAVTQALVMQTGEGTGSSEQFRDVLMGRLQAQARAHSLLLDGQRQHAGLRALVEGTLEAYRVERPDAVTCEGPEVFLNTRQTLGLSLVLHELGTNAAKYGALSQASGRVRITWSEQAAEPGRQIHLLWQEREGPSVEPPTRKGFGAKLIERAVRHELGGRTELVYAAEGLRCVIMFPQD